MNNKQYNALRLATLGHNLFLTGAAGTGKSYVLKHIIKSLKQTKHVAVTASTGTSAFLIDGITTHSWLKLGLANDSLDTLLEKLDRSHIAKKNIRKTQVLIIDEISMISGDFFTKLDSCCRHVKTKTLPFGGIQVILCGDFAQLPPVSKDTIDYAFLTLAWKESNLHTVYLTEIMRQRDDSQFIDILTKIRHNRLEPSDTTILFNCIDKEFDDEEDIYPTRLVPTNNHAKTINDMHFRRLPDPTFRFIMHVVSHTKSNKIPDHVIKKLYERYISGMIHEKSLFLKLGTRVILTSNINVELGLFNGAQGIVTGILPLDTFKETNTPVRIAKRNIYFSIHNPEIYTKNTHEQGSNHHIPVVKFKHGEFAIFPITNIIKTDYSDSPDAYLTIETIPLKHAWALTIHKSQGMTLDRAQIDAGRYVFTSGQTYTALSRVRNLDSLSLIDFEPSKIKVDPVVSQFYESLL